MNGSRFSVRPLALAAVVALGVLPMSLVQAQTQLHGNSKVRVSGNRQSGTVQSKGGKGGVGANVVGQIDLSSATHVNTTALRQQDVRSSQLRVRGNHSEGSISSVGAQAAANSIVADGGSGRSSVDNSHLLNANNRAKDVSASGGSGSVAKGVVASVNKQGRSLANSQSFDGTDVKNTRATVLNNQADRVQTDGGLALANSVLARQSKLDGAQLHQSGNRASQISARGGEGSVAAGAASHNTRSMAAANAVSVRDSELRQDARLLLKNNQATRVDANGGTAFVNSVAVYGQGQMQGGTVAVTGNTAQDVRTQGGSGQVLGGGRSKNGILVANGVYAEGSERAELSRASVLVRGNRANNLQADGGRVNANALAVNGRGKLNGGSVRLDRNQASHISSQGSEATAFGHAAFDRGVGHAQANAVQINGQARDSLLHVSRNTAQQVSASKGAAVANSVVVDGDAQLNKAQVRIARNHSTQVQADNQKTALAASLHNEGQIGQSQVQIEGNRTTSLRATREDAAVASVRNRSAGRIENGSRIVLRSNQGSVAEQGQAHGVDNSGQIRSSRITVAGNHGQVRNQGSISSVENSRQISNSTIRLAGNTGSVSQGGQVNGVHNSGTISQSNIVISGNRGHAQRGGQINSVDNSREMHNSQVLIAGNQGNSDGGGLVNSVKNTGQMKNATVALISNQGSAKGDARVNSVENKGRLNGRVLIAGNHGHATAGGTVNSVINHGDLKGTVVIAGNHGTAMGPGSVANSVINHGRIDGKVAIVGNTTTAGPGMTAGSVRVNHGGSLHAAAGVTGGVGWSANKATGMAPSTGVVSQSVIVGGAADRVYR